MRIEQEEDRIVGSFALQGLVGFCLGGLISLITMMAPALQEFAAAEGYLAYLDFAIGGAAAGYSLAWGYEAKNAPRNAAFGFAIGMLVPAFLVPAATERMVTLEPEAYDTGVFVANFFIYTVAFGFAGALGSGAIDGRLFGAGAARFGLAGGLGGVLLSIGPGVVADAPAHDMRRTVWIMAFLVLGHMAPFLAGGYWFGRAVRHEQLRKLEHKRRSRKFGRKRS